MMEQPTIVDSDDFTVYDVQIKSDKGDWEVRHKDMRYEKDAITKAQFLSNVYRTVRVVRVVTTRVLSVAWEQNV